MLVHIILILHKIGARGSSQLHFAPNFVMVA